MAGEHLQLTGPSGCGKSLLAKHMALAAVRGGRLPIVAPAREYDGKLSALLDRSVAHLHPDTALYFLRLAERTGRPVALILDGFNECPRKWWGQLVKELQAFSVRTRISRSLSPIGPRQPLGLSSIRISGAASMTRRPRPSSA